MNKAKPSKNANVKKKTKRRKKPVKIVQIIGMSMDQIYAVINLTQLKRIEQKLIVDPANGPMIENILRDCQISFEKESKGIELHFYLQPPPEKKISDELFDFSDDMFDEIIEEDTIFGD